MNKIFLEYLPRNLKISCFSLVAAEWRRGIPDRTVKVKLGPGKIIKVSSDRGQLLRTIDLRGMEWIIVFLQSDREQTLLSVRMDREYDMVSTIDVLEVKQVLWCEYV